MKIDDLSIDTVYANAYGSWSRDVFSPVEYWNINYSTILSKLIHEAGRHCNAYASDLFISWQTIDKCLYDRNYTGGRYFFGFRDYGVDSEAFVKNRLEDSITYGANPYESLWILDVVVDGDDITMKLGQSDLVPDKIKGEKYGS